MVIDKTRGLQVFPVGRSWVRALFGSVRSPVQIRAPRFLAVRSDLRPVGVANPQVSRATGRAHDARRPPSGPG